MTFVAGGALKPIGGHILSHSSATRIFLRKGAERWFTEDKTNEFFPLYQVELKNALLSWLIAQRDPKVRRHTSWMRVVGQMFKV
jgi:hypothetical protein